MSKRVIRVKVFDFNTADQNYNRTFDRFEFEKFLQNPSTIKQMKDGKYTCILTHASRIADEELYNQIAPEDKQLKERDIVGIIKKIFIKNNEVYADIVLLQNTESAKFLNELLDLDVKLGVSISFLDCGNNNKYIIYMLNGIDITYSPAMESSYINSISNENGEFLNDNR